ncbi:MAG: PD-(D/E)XK nuclease family transposase [Lachnospiraceae bacterium]
MARRLKDYFPLIRSREEVLEEIYANESLHTMYRNWDDKAQREFLEFCSGTRGVKVTYDGFFKEIMNPEYNRERLESLLSVLLGEDVKIKEVLPNDTVRIADEVSLLITDIVVELSDGSLVNIEIQKFGLLFPGERAACYIADLLLRQYKRVKGIKKATFSYKDIKRVYSIIFLEKSTKEFWEVLEEYLFEGRVIFTKGLKLNIPLEIIFIALDNFKKTQQNRPIETKLEAWLTFISTDEPERVAELIEKYPEFKDMYDEVYEICRNVEEVMGMYSRELREMDKNTIRYMVEELQDEVDQLKNEKQAEVEQVRKEKQAEVEQVRREKQAEVEQVRREKQTEIDQIKKEKQELEERLRRLGNGAG